MSIRNEYASRFQDVLIPLASSLEEHLRGRTAEVLLDRVCCRAKSIERFVSKAEKEIDGIRKYEDPVAQIQDQIGARIVVLYLSDVARISALVEDYYRSIEEHMLVPESESEFGYVGKHYVLFMPSEIVEPEWKDRAPKYFELQIKTLFQHAWSEASHDLGYKPVGELSPDQKRKLAFTAAQSWGADTMFDELFRELGS